MITASEAAVAAGRSPAQASGFCGLDIGAPSAAGPRQASHSHCDVRQHPSQHSLCDRLAVTQRLGRCHSDAADIQPGSPLQRRLPSPRLPASQRPQVLAIAPSPCRACSHGGQLAAAVNFWLLWQWSIGRRQTPAAQYR
jgi:hypothetical protein